MRIIFGYSISQNFLEIFMYYMFLITFKFTQFHTIYRQNKTKYITAWGVRLPFISVLANLKFNWYLTFLMISKSFCGQTYVYSIMLDATLQCDLRQWFPNFFFKTRPLSLFIIFSDPSITFSSLYDIHVFYQKVVSIYLERLPVVSWPTEGWAPQFGNHWLNI